VVETAGVECNRVRWLFMHPSSIMEKHKQKRPCERNKESLQEITGIF